MIVRMEKYLFSARAKFRQQCRNSKHKLRSLIYQPELSSVVTEQRSITAAVEWIKLVGWPAVNETFRRIKRLSEHTLIWLFDYHTS